MSACRTAVCLLGAILLVQDGRARAQARPVEPIIQAVEPVSVPDYGSYRGIERYAPTPSDYARAVGDRAFVMERVTYRSDDLSVYAYVYRPATPDIQNIVGVVRELSYADPERLFLYGESRGGMMTLLAAKGGFPAKAAAVYGTIADFAAFVADGTPARAQASHIWPGFPGNEAEIVESRSALRWPERIGMPLLIMHGGADGTAAPSHALRLASALQRLDKPYELKIFAGEGHVIPGRAAERDVDAAQFFRRYDRR